jgi:hypothetical protein
VERWGGSFTCILAILKGFFRNVKFPLTILTGYVLYIGKVGL